jgi:uncharacterized membrane protein (GlpM family)
MQLLFKAVLGGCIIALCTFIGRKVPSLSGLIAVMPLTGLFAMLWLYYEPQKPPEAMTRYCQGAIWGIIPSILFFITALVCFRKGLPVWLILTISFTVWLAGAFVHQFLLHGFFSSAPR